jgi:hypothetical protein
VILDIVGGLLAVPSTARIDPEGHVHLILEQVDEAEIALGRRYRYWSKITVVLLILGFVGQLVSNYLH